MRLRSHQLPDGTSSRKRLRATLGIGATIAAGALVAATVAMPSASAMVATTVQPGYNPPGIATVGQTVPMQVRFTNANDDVDTPNDGQDSTLTDMLLIPTCGAVDPAGCVSPDPGVVTLSNAVGDGACAGRTFALGAPDPGTGAVTITPEVPGTPVVLADGTMCRINLLATVIKLPTVDALPAPGLQTVPVAHVTSTTVSGAAGDEGNGTNFPLTISKAMPTITSSAAPSNAMTGDPIRDLATVSGEVPDGAANLAFELFGPFAAAPGPGDCTALNRVFSSGVVVNAPGNVLSPATAVGDPGIYAWVAYFSGDANNEPAEELCGAPAQLVTVSGPVLNPPPPAPPVPPAPGPAASCANPTISGGSGDQVIHGTPGDDVISGGSGNDTIYGHGGNDTICLGSGNDVGYGGDGDDVIIGGSGNDEINGDAGNDDLTGNSGDDVIDGGAGTDTADPGSGMDTVTDVP